MTPCSESSTSQGNSSNQLVWNALLHFVESYSLLSKGFCFALCALLPDFPELKYLVMNLSISYGPNKMVERWRRASQRTRSQEHSGLAFGVLLRRTGNGRLEEDDATSVNMAIETEN